ncbi:MAG: ABC transporter ATP-binding protein [Spirochaetales bacterium]|nr:ABC transporter ATP-binding protein [Spirochaetales bacterium]
MEKEILVFDNVSCKFKEFELVMDFSIEKGEFITFFGHSGAGKTTALHLIAGVLKPDSGKILLNGRDVTSLPPWKRNIGVVFQDYSLFPNMNVGKNVGYGVKDKKESSPVSELLDLVGLSGYQKRQIHSLSGGQRQRVALARALATNPDILILDEPLSALDGILRKSLSQEIRRLHRENNLTTIYITHDISEALSFSDKIALFSEGKIVQFDTAQEIYNNPVNLQVAKLTGSLCEIADSNGQTIYFRPENLGIGRRTGMINFKARLADSLFKGSYFEFEWIQEGTEKVFSIPSYCFDQMPLGGEFYLKKYLKFI